MERKLALYISAAGEMDPECELVGQFLAELTPAVRWVIKRTPSPHERANPDLVALRASQFYLILIGSDIVAPVGVEWQAARRASIPTFAYRRAGLTLTPAAAVFVRNCETTWEEYANPQAFARHLERALISEMIRGTPGYGLELADIERLSARLQDIDKGEPVTQEDNRRGASRGGVILPAGA